MISKDGVLEPWARRLLDLLPQDSFVEVSPSGRGLHVVLRGRKPGKRSFGQCAVEIYEKRRFFTMTGQPWRPPAYSLTERTGRGEMGMVFRDYDERLDREVALKQILPARAQNETARRRFLREARLSAGLNHSEVVHIYDIAEADDCDWLVMEYVRGEPLARRIHR